MHCGISGCTAKHKPTLFGAEGDCTMNPAKTNAERQSALVARRKAAGLVSLKNVWVHPDDVPEMREHAAKLARRRELAAKRAAP